MGPCSLAEELLRASHAAEGAAQAQRELAATRQEHEEVCTITCLYSLVLWLGLYSMGRPSQTHYDLGEGVHQGPACD